MKPSRPPTFRLTPVALALLSASAVVCAQEAPVKELPYGALWATLPWPEDSPFDHTALEQRYEAARFGEFRVDGQGRAWVGNWGFDFMAGEKPATTVIARVAAIVALFGPAVVAVLRAAVGLGAGGRRNASNGGHSQCGERRVAQKTRHR